MFIIFVLENSLSDKGPFYGIVENLFHKQKTQNKHM